jgi:hypothetical protein
MNWMRLTDPNSSLMTGLKAVAGAAFFILGILFMLDSDSFVEGAALAAISCGWLFLVIRNYRKQQINLESLR